MSRKPGTLIDRDRSRPEQLPMYKAVLSLPALLAPPVLSQVKAPAPEAPALPDPIPLTQVALQSQELTRTLAEISRRLPPDSELAAVDNDVREQEDWFQNKLKESAGAISADATLTEIRAQLREWRACAVRQAQQQQERLGYCMRTKLDVSE